MADDERLVKVERDPKGFAFLRLNRPRSANAANSEMLRQLYFGLKECGADPSVGAVVLRGEGKHFSAGGDIKEFAARGEDLPAYMVEITGWLNSCVLAMVRLPKPIDVKATGTMPYQNVEAPTNFTGRPTINPATVSASLIVPRLFTTFVRSWPHTVAVAGTLMAFSSMGSSRPTPT